MNCDFQLTNYRTTHGDRPVSRCSRPGCSHVAFSWPQNITAECQHPSFAAGDAVANTLAKVNVTERSWARFKHFMLVTLGLKDYKAPVGGCGCGAKKAWLNRKFTRAFPNWMYAILVLVGKRRPRDSSRIETLLALGKIK